MARARPARTPTPDQLTLEDWAETLNVSPEAPETPDGEATRVDPLGKTPRPPGEQGTWHRQAATALLETPGALVTRTHLRALGLERRAVDAVFRALPVVVLPGYSRPMILVQDFLQLLEHRTFRDDRVRPMARAP